MENVTRACKYRIIFVVKSNYFLIFSIGIEKKKCFIETTFSSRTFIHSHGVADIKSVLFIYLFISSCRGLMLIFCFFFALSELEDSVRAHTHTHVCNETTGISFAEVVAFTRVKPKINDNGDTGQI